jgi:hypothetical protein
MTNHMSARGPAVLVAVSIGLLAQGLGSATGADPTRQESREEKPRPERPSYEIARAAAPIEVDGRLDEPAWQAAEAFTFVTSVDGSPPPPDLGTVAKALYDDVFIYFAFDNVDTNAWSTRDERDQHLWEEEVVEVFIQADPAHPSYIELEVNPLGAMLDIFLIDVRKPIPYRSWNSAGLRWAVQVDGTVDGRPGDVGWSCEMALPLEDVITAPHLPPRPGDRWRLNLYRVERRPSRASLAWSPTLVRDFHRPERFGDLVFSDRVVP